MRKQQAEAIANEMAAAGYKPILAQVKRNGLPKSWEVWGVDPKTQQRATIMHQEQWAQRKQQEVQP